MGYSPSDHIHLLGIVGGFAPPTPDAIHTLELDVGEVGITSTPGNHPVLKVTSAIRPIGTPDLQGALPKALPVPTESDEEKAIHELRDILKELPTEQPPGSEDIYGMNTSIAWQSEDLQWFNGGPAGCSGGYSSVKASEEHKAKFKRAITIVNELVIKAK
jgi:hypothetical protein